MIMTFEKAKIEKIKDRLEYWEAMMDHPELLGSEQEQRDILEQWRGAHFILRNLGIEI